MTGRMVKVACALLLALAAFFISTLATERPRQPERALEASSPTVRSAEPSRPAPETRPSDDRPTSAALAATGRADGLARPAGDSTSSHVDRDAHASGSHRKPASAARVPFASRGGARPSLIPSNGSGVSLRL